MTFEEAIARKRKYILEDPSQNEEDRVLICPANEDDFNSYKTQLRIHFELMEDHHAKEFSSNSQFSVGVFSLGRCFHTVQYSLVQSIVFNIATLNQAMVQPFLWAAI